MKIEIEDVEGSPWILVTAEDQDEWIQLLKIRDDIYAFENDACFGEYDVPGKIDERARQISWMLHSEDMAAVKKSRGFRIV